MKIKCDTQVLESYKRDIKTFCQNQCEAVKKLKRKCETANWHDRVYTQAMNELNEVLMQIAAAIAELTDGINVRLLDELIPRAEQYAQTKSRYPQ